MDVQNDDDYDKQMKVCTMILMGVTLRMNDMCQTDFVQRYGQPIIAWNVFESFSSFQTHMDFQSNLNTL